MKRIIAFLLVITGFVSKAEFEGLANVKIEVVEERNDIYTLNFILKLKDGAYTYVPSEDLLAPPAFEVILDPSVNYQSLGDWKYPNHKTKYVEELEVDVNYFDDAEFVMSKQIKAQKSDFSISAKYLGQICEKGRCVFSKPGSSVIFNIGKGGEGANSPPGLSNEINISDDALPNSCGYDFSKEKNELKTFEGKSIDEVDNSSFWETFFIAFLFGLAAILTPCVFPMVPMTVSFFLKGSENKAKGKLTALVFGFSIIVIYVLIGTIMTAFLPPESAGLIATHWIPNLIFFGIFIFFAASFFGMFEITLPSKWSNASDEKADKGGIAGAIFMAVTLTIVSFSCTGPIIGTVLVKSFTTGGIEPIIAMLGFSIAFALPFTLFAFVPSMLNSLPKSGGWLNSVKVVFGFLELALALKFLSIADLTEHWGLLDRDVFLALWIVIFSLLGFYLLGKLKFAHDSDLPFIKVPRLIFAIAVFTFVVYLLPGMWGAPLKGLSGYLPPMSTMEFQLTEAEDIEGDALCNEVSYSSELHLPHGLKGYYDWEEGMCCAKEQGKPVFIDFTGHSCANCREIENNVWSDPDVLEFLREEFIIISLYTDERTLKLKQPYTAVFDGKTKMEYVGEKAYDIQKTWFNKVSQPYYVTMDNEKELLEFPIAYQGASDKKDFLKFLKKSLSNYKKRK